MMPPLASLLPLLALAAILGYLATPSRLSIGVTSRHVTPMVATTPGRVAVRGISPLTVSTRTFKRRPAFAVRAADAAPDSADSGLIREVNAPEWDAMLRGVGNKLLMVDFYTDWCGPCKMIYPYLEELASEYEGKLEIVKMNCAGENRELVNSLGVRVLPTFIFYKNEKNIATVKGAKRGDLKEIIEENS